MKFAITVVIVMAFAVIACVVQNWWDWRKEIRK